MVHFDSLERPDSGTHVTEPHALTGDVDAASSDDRHTLKEVPIGGASPVEGQCGVSASDAPWRQGAIEHDVGVSQRASLRRHDTQRLEDERRLHLAVLTSAMRSQGFSERSIRRARQQATRLLLALTADGTRIPTPRVFDPKAPSGRSRREGAVEKLAPIASLDRAPAPPSPVLPAR
jgi:hypothetical protein